MTTTGWERKMGNLTAAVKTWRLVVSDRNQHPPERDDMPALQGAAHEAALLASELRCRCIELATRQQITTTHSNTGTTGG